MGFSNRRFFPFFLLAAMVIAAMSFQNCSEGVNFSQREEDSIISASNTSSNSNSETENHNGESVTPPVYGSKDLTYVATEDLKEKFVISPYFLSANQSLARRIELVSGASNGGAQLIEAEPGYFYYQGNLNFYGNDQLTVREFDPSGVSDPVERVLSIIVNNVLDDINVGPQFWTLSSYIETRKRSDIVSDEKINDPSNNPDHRVVKRFILLGPPDVNGKRVEQNPLKVESQGFVLSYDSDKDEFTFSGSNVTSVQYDFMLGIEVENGVVFQVPINLSYKNPLDILRPALAVKDSKCIFCHSYVRGNVVTDFGFNGASGDIDVSHGLEGLPKISVGTGDIVRGLDDFFRSGISSSYIEGTVFVPRKNLNTASKTAIGAWLNVSLKSYNLVTDTTGSRLVPIGGGASIGASNRKTPEGSWPVVRKYASLPASIDTVGDYVHVMLQRRTADEVKAIKRVNRTEGQILSMPIPADTKDNNVLIREIQAVTLGYPIESEIRSLLDAADVGRKASYYKDNVRQVALPAGLSYNSAKGFFYNEALQVFQCEGDLVLTAPLYFKNLKIRSQSGCRIYSSRGVYIEGPKNPSASSTTDGIIWDSESDKSNLQISSSLGIMMGLGKCAVDASPSWTLSYPYQSQNLRLVGSLGGRARFGTFERVFQARAGVANLSQELFKEAQNTIADVNGTLLNDAANACGDRAYNDFGRRVGFKHLLLNAPQIESRYTGDFSGVIITEYAVMSLGQFEYTFDEYFARKDILILPKLKLDRVFAPSMGCADDDTMAKFTGFNQYRVCK